MEIAFVGDVMLGRLVAEELRRRPPEYPWGDTLPLLRRADALVGNLEFVLADDGRPWPGKTFHFRADRRAVASLEAAGFALVSAANNHVLDFGTDAALESLATLAQRGIRFAGAGPNAEAARRPAVIRRDGLTIAMLAFTDNEPDWEAGPESPGVHHVPVDLDDPRAAALLDCRRPAARGCRPAHRVGALGRELGRRCAAKPPDVRARARRRGSGRRVRALPAHRARRRGVSRPADPLRHRRLRRRLRGRSGRAQRPLLRVRVAHRERGPDRAAHASDRDRPLPGPPRRPACRRDRGLHGAALRGTRHARRLG